jgi:hypothetical protein
VENLSEADREFIKAGETGRLPKGAEQAVTEAMKMFRPTPEMDRSKIPLIAEISDSDNHTVVEAFAPFSFGGIKKSSSRFQKVVILRVRRLGSR